MPAPGKRTSWLVLASDAWAGADDAEVGAIRELLGRYAAALSARSVEQVAVVQPSLTADARERLNRYFQNAGDLHVRIAVEDVDRIGDAALVTYVREDTFVDPSGRRIRLEHRLTAELKKQPDGSWAIAALGTT